MDNSENRLDAGKEEVEPSYPNYPVEYGAESGLDDTKPQTNNDHQHPDKSLPLVMFWKAVMYPAINIQQCV